MRIRMLLLAPLVLGFAAVAAECKSKPSTEVVVGASTQMSIRDIRSMRVVVRAGDVRACRTIDLEKEHAAVETVRATAAGAVTATVAGYAEPAAALSKDDCAIDGTPKVLRTHTTTIPDGETLYLGMPLRQLCKDVVCGNGQTCIAGECSSGAIDSATLVTYGDTLVRGDTSFCLSPAKCFEDVVPALLADDRDCTFQIPDEAKLDDHMNVELLHDDLSREILDHASPEGFTRLDDRRFRIAPNLCKRYLSRQISALYVGANCNPKSALQPICTKREEAHDAGVAERTLCTRDATLLPVKTAIHLLVDRSSSMAHFYGPDGLADPVDLLLRWPLLRQTLVGFDQLPSNAVTCASDDNPFATPKIPVGPIETTRPLVRAALADGSSLSPDGRVFLDSALRENGAYAALANANALQKQLLVAGNRDLGPNCVPSIGPPDALAAKAFDRQGIATNILLLNAPPGTDTHGRDAYGDAVLTTRAGHGTFFDGSIDDKSVRLGLLSIVVPLVSCLYDLPEGFEPDSDLSGVKLSYFELIGSTRVDVDRDATCSQAGGLGGWNLEGRKVRLCGKACTDLRFMLTFAAQYALDRKLVPIDVPMKWASACK